MVGTELGDGKTKRVPVSSGVFGLVNKSIHFCIVLVRFFELGISFFYLPRNGLAD